MAPCLFYFTHSGQNIIPCLFDLTYMYSRRKLGVLFGSVLKQIPDIMSVYHSFIHSFIHSGTWRLRGDHGTISLANQFSMHFLFFFYLLYGMSYLLSFIIILSLSIQPYGCKDNTILSLISLLLL